MLFSVKVVVQCDKLMSVISQTKLKTLVTVDVV